MILRECSRCGRELRGHAFVTRDGKGIEHGRCAPVKAKLRTPLSLAPLENPNEPTMDVAA